jgi:hypothetical protein
MKWLCAIGFGIAWEFDGELRKMEVNFVQFNDFFEV